MRVSKADGSQMLDLQHDALIDCGVLPEHIYEDMASGKKDDRPGLVSCLKALRKGDTLIVWKLDRLGRNLRHLINTVHSLDERGISFKVLAGQGAQIDTTTSQGRLVFSIFAALAEYERELISERTKAGLESARARGRKGGAPRKMTKTDLSWASLAIVNRDITISEICKRLKISRQTLYRHVAPDGNLRSDGDALLKKA